MGPLKKYDLEVNGVRTSMWLDDDDAELYGVVKPLEDEETVAPAGKERPVANKARKPRNKGVA